jgi:hypothetical protein
MKTPDYDALMDALIQAGYVLIKSRLDDNADNVALTAKQKKILVRYLSQLKKICENADKE